jgi:hypothetical protein
MTKPKVNISRKPAVAFLRKVKNLSHHSYPSIRAFCRALQITPKVFYSRVEQFSTYGIVFVDVKPRSYCNVIKGAWWTLVENPKWQRQTFRVWYPHNKKARAKKLYEMGSYKNIKQADEIWSILEADGSVPKGGPPLYRSPLPKNVSIITTTKPFVNTTKELSTKQSDSFHQKKGKLLSVNSCFQKPLGLPKSWRQRDLVDAQFAPAYAALDQVNVARKAVSPCAMLYPATYGVLEPFARFFRAGGDPKQLQRMIRRKQTDAKLDRTKLSFLNGWVSCNPLNLKQVLSYLDTLPDYKPELEPKDEFKGLIVNLTAKPLKPDLSQLPRLKYKPKPKQKRAFDPVWEQRPRLPEYKRNYRRLDEVNQFEINIALEWIKKLKESLHANPN